MIRWFEELCVLANLGISRLLDCPWNTLLPPQIHLPDYALSVFDQNIKYNSIIFQQN